jgi:transposase
MWRWVGGCEWNNSHIRYQRPQGVPWAKAQLMRASGMSLRQIAAEMQTHEKQIRRWLAGCGQ